MTPLPSDLFPLAALVFALGARHGLDADHLAVIDGLTRFNTGRQRRFARWYGALFALGHGAVVIAVATAVSAASRHVALPAWLDTLGAWLSICCLAALGGINLLALWRAAPGQPLAPVGLKGRFAAPLRQAGRPGAVMAVGVLFALSLDTLAQAALFGGAAAPHGVLLALGLGALFLLGMVLVDGLNGLWVSRLIACADRSALVASRVMTAVVAGAALLLATLGAARRLSPTLDDWNDTHALPIGLALLVLLAAGYVLARALARIQLPSAGVEET
jgi:high-affinity nickel-transport protein